MPGRFSHRRLRAIQLLVGVVAALLLIIGGSNAAQRTAAPIHSRANKLRTVRLPNRTVARIAANGVGTITRKNGTTAPLAVSVSQYQAANGLSAEPSDSELAQQVSDQQRGVAAPGNVVVALSVAPTQSTVKRALERVHAGSLKRLFSGQSDATLSHIGSAAQAQLGDSAVALTNSYIVHVSGDATEAARTLRATPGVNWAEPDWYVSTFDTGAGNRTTEKATTDTGAGAGPSLPSNYGLQSSLESYLNQNGVDAVSAYGTLQQRFGELPGQGETITNISVGDLTDQTTELSNGQRYLNVRSMPLIPTYVASPSGQLDPTGTASGEDPSLGEVLLDFSVMAPLPHDQQRAGEQGSGLSDLLGIAPGANYRLVIPQQPTIANIESAFVAAATQTPRPDVITASLGYGVDTVGFPGRYLEDDPVMQSIIAGIVKQYGIVVTIASNDGTRTYTPAAVGPDGGSAPTNLATGPSDATSFADDMFSTIPSKVVDSGAMAIGGTTLDDTLAVPPQTASALAHNPTFATTRTDGATNFSSGFGSRVDVSAPSDNIPILIHAECGTSPSCKPDTVFPTTAGGTSAATPMVAAAAAVVLQTARLEGRSLTPQQVRSILERTGRPVASPPQMDQQISVGPQIDLGAAVDSLIGGGGDAQPQIVRMSIAHRETTSGADTGFTEATDPTNVDLAGPRNTGSGVYGPITFGLDLVNPPAGAVSYRLTANGGGHFDSSVPFVRVTPSELFAAAGKSLVSTSPQSFPVTFAIIRGQTTLASTTQQLTFGPSDGTYAEPQAPVVAPVVQAGADVPVSYDISRVRNLPSPELVLSSVGHWNPFTASNFRVAYRIPLTQPSGTVTIPASALSNGGGVYGVGIVPNSNYEFIAGDFASFRVAGSDASQRPQGPTLSTGSGAFAHQLYITRAQPGFSLRYDVTGVTGADGATLEISAPGPTVFNSLNTFTNENGSARDDNGGDTGSTVFQPLGATSGTAQFDASKLGLGAGDSYDVRLLATQGGTAIGQASPSSYLEYDDMPTPDGSYVTDFNIDPAGGSTVATYGADGTDLRHFDPSTGTYGSPLANDPTGQSEFRILGDDPSLHRTAAIQDQPNGTEQSVDVFDTQSGSEIASVPVSQSSQYRLEGGRVDQTDHRAVILGQAASDGTDTVLPFDLTTDAFGTAIGGDVGSAQHRLFNEIEVDQSTGKAYLVRVSQTDTCFVLRPNDIESVDVNGATASPLQSSSRCLTGEASDQANGSLYTTVGPMYSFSGKAFPLLPTGHLEPYDETSLTAGPVDSLPADGSYSPVIDPVNHLALVAFVGTGDYLTNNNAMSAVGVVDLRSGNVVSLIPHFNFITSDFGFATNNPVPERQIQIDPATRTGWTFGPGATQIVRFSY